MKNLIQSQMGPLFDWLSLMSQNLIPGESATCLLTNPDQIRGAYSGSILEDGCVVHSYQSLVDLAEIHGFRLLTPEKLGDLVICVRFEKLDSNKFWPTKTVDDAYGAESEFSRIMKAEEPWFLSSFRQAIQDVEIKSGWNLLHIGLNRGDELQFLKEQVGAVVFERLKVTGVDINKAAVERAQEEFESDKNVKVICNDIQRFKELELPQQDMIVAIDTLQSSGLNGKELIVHLRKELLKPFGAFILGFPNTRYLDGGLSYGARVRNYTEPEFSLLVRDLFFYRRYLQQQGFRVKITGKYTVFLTAIKTDPEQI